jgi:hypothetical protein
MAQTAQGLQHSISFQPRHSLRVATACASENVESIWSTTSGNNSSAYSGPETNLPIGDVLYWMTRTRKTLLVLLPTICVAGCHKQSDSISLDEIIERNTDAMGGRAAIEAVQSIQIDLHIKDPSFKVDGTYNAARPGKMRIDVSAEGKHVFTEAFDGLSGWAMGRQR